MLGACANVVWIAPNDPAPSNSTMVKLYVFKNIGWYQLIGSVNLRKKILFKHGFVMDRQLVYWLYKF
jgi:hypothetical protein